jgi:hypothetical protein
MDLRGSTTSDIVARCARLVLAILLVGGMASWPLVHLAPEGPEAASHHESPQAPDAHHDCAVCLTLASPALPPLAAVPTAEGTAAVPRPSYLADFRDGAGADLTRARAPPHA